MPLLKTYKEAGISNPNKLFDYISEYLLKENNHEYYIPEIVSLLVERVDDYLTNGLDNIDRKNYEIYFKYRLRNAFGIRDDYTPVELDPSSIEIIINCLKEEIVIDNYFDNFKEYLDAQCFVYDRNIDKLCLIVDRDSHSFVSKQYDELIAKCKNCEVDLYVSNLCFEFWLLLHFDKVLSLNSDKIRENKSVKPSLKYTEYELKKLVPSYKKNKVPFEKFIDNIDNAIKNEKYFCENIVQIKENIGSNIGLLFSELMKKD